MKPLSIETQRELVDALDALLAFQQRLRLSDAPVNQPARDAAIALGRTVREARAALAKARAEMGGGGE